MKYTLALSALAASALLAAVSCKRSDNEPPRAVTLDGFAVNGVVYAVDSIARDTAGPGSRARLHSSSHGGGYVELKFIREDLPETDSLYHFGIGEQWKDITSASLRFVNLATGDSTYVETNTAALKPSMKLSIANGKWCLSVTEYNRIPGGDSTVLSINYCEKGPQL